MPTNQSQGTAVPREPACPQLPLPTASLGAPGSSSVRHPGPSPVGHLVPLPRGTPAPPHMGPHCSDFWQQALQRLILARVCTRCLLSGVNAWAEPCERSVRGWRGLRPRTGESPYSLHRYRGRDTHSQLHAHTRECSHFIGFNCTDAGTPETTISHVNCNGK